MLDEIRQILQQHKNELKNRYGVKEIGVFGSYVRGEQEEGSDLDVLVALESNAKMDLIRFVELEEHLSELLGVRVDLVMKSALKPRIRRRILREVIYL